MRRTEYVYGFHLQGDNSLLGSTHCNIKWQSYFGAFCTWTSIFKNPYFFPPQIEILMDALMRTIILSHWLHFHALCSMKTIRWIFLTQCFVRFLLLFMNMLIGWWLIVMKMYGWSLRHRMGKWGLLLSYLWKELLLCKGFCYLNWAGKVDDTFIAFNIDEVWAVCACFSIDCAALFNNSVP